MRLQNPLISSFIFDDKEFDIDLSFDNVLDVFDVLEDSDLRHYERAELCVELLTGQQLNGEEAIVLWNYIYESFVKIDDKKSIEYDLKGNPMPVNEEESERHISIDQDAEYIYASFMQAYQINLYKEHGKMHWYEFQSLLNGLPADTFMQRVIQIRAWKPSKGDTAEYRNNMKDLQKVYALKTEGVE